ncbi:hypothetical protein HUJ04_004720 [Dendroctonus ponderosae]
MQDLILKGPKVEDQVSMGFGEYFWLTAEKFGDRIFQIHAYTEATQTFGRVKQKALRVAIQLRKFGVKEKDVVMVCGENDLNDIVPVLAGLFLGACVSCTAPLMGLYDYEQSFASIKPKAIFVIQRDLHTIVEATKFLDYEPLIFVMGESGEYPTLSDMEQRETEEESTFKPVEVNIYDPAFILFSSGTTSAPKGIYLSHFTILSGPCRLNNNHRFVLDTPLGQFCTLFWISCLWVTSYSIVNAQPLIVAPSIKTERYLELIDKYKIAHCFLFYSTVVNMANTELSILLKYDLSHVTYVSWGGTYIDAKYILKLRKIFPNALVYQSYAATEIGAIPFGWRDFDQEAYNNKLLSVGKVNINTEVKIIDIESGQLLGPNQTGEILIKSPYRMLGYTNLDSSQNFDDDGFLKTGDIGYYDEQHYFYIVDRLKQGFKYRAMNIFPQLVEETLRKHPAVDEAVVFPMYHEVDFSHPAACIVLQKNAHASAQELSDFVVKNMSEIHRLRAGIKFLNSMPFTASGKIARTEVKKLFFADRGSL